MKWYMTLIESARAKNKIPVAKLARMCKMSRANYYAYLKGERDPLTDRFFKMVDAVNAWGVFIDQSINIKKGASNE